MKTKQMHINDVDDDDKEININSLLRVRCYKARGNVLSLTTKILSKSRKINTNFLVNRSPVLILTLVELCKLRKD